MSSSDQTLNTGQQATTNYDISKIFIWNKRTDKFSYNNSTYDAVTLTAGTLMGRIHATGLVVPLTSAASDGSQFPIGVLLNTHVVDEGDTVEVAICVAGDVVEDKVILQGSDTMDTVISARRLRDRIGSDTVGIKLVESTELTAYDNQ